MLEQTLVERSCGYSPPYPQILDYPEISRQENDDNGKESTVNRALGGSTYPG